ncbi:hypothetical protein RvVAR0630_34150 [Agrobacterium vitis]|nr:hypothetical protein RvVAR0630_34150 [Agrobacterium vitis]
MLNENNNFRVDPDQVRNLLARVQVDYFVLVTPNNPTGAAVPDQDIEEILEICGEHNVRLVIDQSFADFQNDNARHKWMVRSAQDPRIIHLLSLGKSHGIGGLRIGVITSGDDEFIRSIRKHLPIWNINGFGEEYLRIFSAFKREFDASCEKVRNDVAKLSQGLKNIKGLKIFPSHSNFVFAKIEYQDITSNTLCSWLLNNEGILVKNCSGKEMNDGERFVRIASRGSLADEKLIAGINRALSALKVV